MTHKHHYRRNEECQRLNLGELIDLLSCEDQSNSLSFDFGGTVPTVVSSYRGYYRDLAICFSDWPAEWPTVGSFLEVLKKAVGQTFHGYKGGDFTMGRSSRVWIANYGNTSGTVIVGLCDSSCGTVIKTQWEND